MGPIISIQVPYWGTVIVGLECILVIYICRIQFFGRHTNVPGTATDKTLIYA